MRLACRTEWNIFKVISHTSYFHEIDQLKILICVNLISSRFAQCKSTYAVSAYLVFFSNPIARHFKLRPQDTATGYTMKPVCNDHLYNKIYYLWFIQ